MGPPNVGAGIVDVFLGAHMATTSAMYVNGVSNFFLLTIIINGASSSIRSNGVQIKTGNVGGGSIGDGSGGFGIGHATYNAFSFGNYDFQRFLLWTNTLTTQFLTNAENQLISDFHIIGL